MTVTLFRGLIPGVDKLSLDEGEPRVSGATCWGINRVRLTFNRDMLVRLPEGLVGEITSYQIRETSSPSVVLPIIRVVTYRNAPTIIDLFCFGMMEGTDYTIQAVSDVLDVYGTTINHTFDSATFLGYGHQVAYPGGLDLFIGLEAGVQKLTESDWRPDLIPPYVENKSPVPGSPSVISIDPISFDLKDNETGVRTLATVVWVQGVPIYYNLSTISGWTAVVTPIANGYHYELSHTVPLPYDTNITVRVYGEDLAFLVNTVDTSWTFHIQVEPLTIGPVKISNVFVVSDDLIKIEFASSLATDSLYYLLSNYYITVLDGSPPVVVEQVLEAPKPKVPYVFIVVRGLTQGGKYQFHIPYKNLFAANGTYIPEHTFSWSMRRTKVDSTRNSLARFYDTKSRSMIRGLIEAIMISDEKIGGDY